ncbi:coiled-coil domain-containing protein 90B, mitochondrial isoform X3 [Toxotes jaculatrix]|uniref:coiled-coil domain-containing protein 90B, mitochondrial isoform X3 n=1 Tax=Toxotes jaculatrix TaxID=941984 RepID=UPI001B3ABCF2|nr:coiled-coil domain-containing protein 90B, mitochondrial isoform X3 [Toxotes jaculatrix]
MNALLRWNLRRLGTWRDFHVTAPVMTFDLRKVELKPLEQRKLTFDSHAMVTELESSGFEKLQAELIVSALVTLTTANMDIVYKDMVTKSHQKMKQELEQLQNRLKEESRKVREETKLDINLESSRISDMFTEQEKRLMEATTEFHHKKADLENDNMEINKKIDLEVASLKTVLESLKLETVRYMAATLFSCLAIALGVYRLWR